MAALDLVARNGVYVTKGGNEDRKILSNCTLELTKAVRAGERSGYLGRATHRNGSIK